MAWRKRQAREDRRVALGAWVLASVHLDSEKRAEPYTLEEVVGWLGHGFHLPGEGQKPVAEPPTAEELLERVHMLNGMYGGKTA